MIDEAVACQPGPHQPPPLPGAATGSEAVRFEPLRGGYKEGEKRVR
jgi:hypothetical protein